MSLAARFQFLQQYIRKPNVVGAVLPSSRSLAAALCKPYADHDSAPARVLEVGAGTGPVTRQLGSLLREGDYLDICEVSPEFADILQRDVLTHRDFAPAVAQGRVRLLRMPVQQLTAEHRYDFIISGLPLTAFTLEDVKVVLEVIRRCLAPGGVFSYFEYVGLRRVSEFFALGRRRARIHAVSDCLNENIRKHQFERHTVLCNVPPAYARYLKFDARQVKARA